MVIFQCSVEPRNNEPPEVLGITNDFLCPSNSKIYEKEPRHNKARYSKHSKIQTADKISPKNFGRLNQPPLSSFFLTVQTYEATRLWKTIFVC